MKFQPLSLFMLRLKKHYPTLRTLLRLIPWTLSNVAQGWGFLDHIADFRRQHMHYFTNLKETRVTNVDDMLRWRDQLMHSVPITDERLTACDLWLAARTKRLPFRTCAEVMWRTCYVSALKYEHETDPEIQHNMLLSIRECYRMLMRTFPMPYCEQMAQVLFDEWCDVLLTEEEQMGREERLN
jgi:hypothetical protein